ncbi:polysaccharide export protein [Epibacterium ulvae]|nr:polysaccharide export protein [Epibacterium ulvae]
MMTIVVTGAVGTVAFGVGPASAQAGSYIIKPGDTLRLEVLEDTSLNRNALVLPDGTISFPLVGVIRPSGRTVNQVQNMLRGRLAPNFATPPTVHVSVAALRNPAEDLADPQFDIFALGEVLAPGRKEVEPGITLLQFLAEAGGLSRFAAEKRIELHRTDPQTGQVATFLFNYRVPQGDGSTINGGTRLQAGDVIKVPQKRLFE